MITYILKSQGLHKIGKTKDLEDRLAAYRTHNPYFELIYTIPVDCEELLHNLFKSKRKHLEWFELDDNDIAKIAELSVDYGLNAPEIIDISSIINITFNETTQQYIINNNKSKAFTSSAIDYLRTKTDLNTITTNSFDKLINRLMTKNLLQGVKCSPTGSLQIIYTTPFIVTKDGEMKD